MNGSVSVVVVAVMSALAVIAAIVVALAVSQVASERAASAAEAAALAAAPATFPPFGRGEPPAAHARRLAAENGATLVSCVCPADATYAARTVVVTVSVDAVVPIVGVVTVQRTAAAEFSPVELLR